jgi:hypothetical protein
MIYRLCYFYELHKKKIFKKNNLILNKCFNYSFFKDHGHSHDHGHGHGHGHGNDKHEHS